MNKSISEKLLENSERTSLQDALLMDLLDEIDLIADPSIKAFVKSVLVRAETFWKAPSSIADDLHPPDEWCEGGLVLHTKRVVRTALLISNSFECSSNEFDCLIAAALIHDVTRAIWRDKEKTGFIQDSMHPYTVDSFVEWSMLDDRDKSEDAEFNTLEVSEESSALILRLVRCSHGIWSPIQETIPITFLEKALHVADLIATNLHHIIDGKDILEKRWV